MKHSIGSRLVAPSILSHRWRLVALGALVAVMAFVGVLQAGIIAPVMWHGNIGPGGSVDNSGADYSFISIDNPSVRAWTVTAQFANGKDTEHLPGGATVRVTLFGRFLDLSDGLADPGRQLTVQPAHQFYVAVAFEHGGCRDTFRGKGDAKLSVLLAVATPLGTRSIPESINVGCDSGE